VGILGGTVIAEHSRTGAMTVALNSGSGWFAVDLLAACVRFRVRSDRRAKLGRAVGLSAVAGLVLTGSIYLALPTTQVRLVKSR